MTSSEQRTEAATPEQRVSPDTRPPEFARVERGRDSGDGRPSYIQRLLWAMEQIEAGTSRFNVCYTLRLNGQLNVDALTAALTGLVARHDALRTRCVADDKSKLKIETMPPWPFVLPAISIASNSASALREAVEQEANRPFGMEQEPLIRGVLYRFSDSEHLLQLTVHELVTDGWSMVVLFRELAALYNAELTGAPSGLSDLTLSYADYARWQNDLMAGPEGERLLAYWTNELQGAKFALQLPTDHARPPQQTFPGGHRRFVVPADLLAEIHACCAQHETTPFTVLLAGIIAVLARYSGQDDLVIGTPTAPRLQADAEQMVGCFINPLVLRAKLEGDPSFQELLHQVRTTMSGAIANENLPFELLRKKLGQAQDHSRSALFQVMVAFQDFAPSAAGMAELETHVEHVANDSSLLDLSLEFTAVGDTLELMVEYNTDLFRAETIDRLWNHLREYLVRALKEPDAKTAAIALLSETERHQQLVEWNDTAVPYPRETPFAQLLAAQAERTPEAIAVTCEGQQLTFRAWNEQANRLAHELLKHGAAPGQLIAVFLQRNLDLMIALLAVVKTGAAYLPLDPALPADRIAYMLEDGGATVAIVEEDTQALLPAFAGTVLAMRAEAWAANSSENPHLRTAPDDLAYVIYTSGSTGKPKGVEVKAASLINLLCCMRDWLQLDERDRVLALTTISFDVSMPELWLPPLVGAQVVLVGREAAANGGLLQQLIDQHDITFMQATPTTWQLLFRSGWTGKANLQAICTAEPMSPDLAGKLAAASARAWNMYGPTETTVWSTGYRLTGKEDPVPVGRPLANTQCYILDALLQPVPIGVTGDLYIGGDGVARGYRNRPDLTEQAFLRNPFAQNANEAARLYRTGDLARYRSDGTIECLGRTDTQVKVRGYRIELGEIEAALTDQPAVAAAAVIVRQDAVSGPQLVAYVVPSHEAVLDLAEVQSRLRLTLPYYMLPAEYQQIAAMPLSANGKTDRHALPAVGGTRAPLASGYDVPRGPVEEALARIWAEVLEVPRVGIHDDYFAMGGDSITAVRLILEIRAAFPDARPSLTTFLKAPTVSEFARTLRAGQADWSYLVAVREGSERTPFFCVHGAGGNVLSMRDLAMAMPEDQPFYCLQARGFDGKSPPFTSVEETAECYVQQIRKVQPHGPYHLGGGCYGGLVAFEMARQLRATGESVGVLALIDSQHLAHRVVLSPMALLARNARFIGQRIRHHVRELREAPSPRLPRVWRSMGVGIRLAMNAVLHAFGKPGLAPMPRQPVVCATHSPAGELEVANERVRQASLTAARNYVPSTYDGHLWVFRARHRDEEPYADDTMGWAPFVTGGITAQEIDADHIAIFRRPGVNAIAEEIDAAIRHGQAGAAVQQG